MKNKILSIAATALCLGAILFAAAPKAQAQFNSSDLASHIQTITVPSGVTGGSLTNGTTTAIVGSRGFAFIATIGTTNAVTTNTISYAWRVSVDGSSTNYGAAIYTNTFLPAAAALTNRVYGVVPNTAINGGIVHLTILNGNDATNRITTQTNVSVISF